MPYIFIKNYSYNRTIMTKLKSALSAATVLTTVLYLMTGQNAFAGSGSMSYQVDYVSQFGTNGTGNGEFNGPVEQMAFGPNNNLYVTDRGNSRIQVFDKDGNYVSQFGSGDLNTEVGIAYNAATDKF